MPFSSVFRRKRILWAVFVLVTLFGLDTYIGLRYSTGESSDLRFYDWDSETLWRLKPFIRATIYGRAFHTNSAGFRGKEEYPVSPSRKFRILVLGDSRTYGMAVSDDSTYSYVLQEELRNLGHDVEVINAGTPGYTAVQCRLKLEQLIHYKPAVAVFAAGYNDRRYLVSTPPDSAKSFRRTALLRRTVGLLHNSNILSALSARLGDRRLRKLRADPPALDKVAVRVPESVFREETRRFISICRENGISPFFLLIQQNPGVFGTLENAAERIERGEYQRALEILNEKEQNLHIAAVTYCHYLQGLCYRALGEEEKARGSFADHRPMGYAEAILRSEECYFRIVREIAKQEKIPILESRDAVKQINEKMDGPLIRDLLDRSEEENHPLADGSQLKPRVEGRIVDFDNFFRARFIDDCHYDQLGHILIGKALADALSPYCRTSSTRSVTVIE